MIQLADRNLISEETLQRKFGDNPDMERVRITRETKGRDSGRIPDKAGPYHDANTDSALKKIALQTQVVTPSEVGLELEDRMDGQESGLELRNKQQKKNQQFGKPGPEQEQKGTPQEGRPKNSKDIEPRKQKQVNPRTKAVLQIQARAAQDEIATIINPIILDLFDKKNFRSLSSKQSDDAERIRFGVLYNLESLSNIDLDSVQEALSHSIPSEIDSLYTNWIYEFSRESGRTPTVEECRQIQASIYSEYKK